MPPEFKDNWGKCKTCGRVSDYAAAHGVCQEHPKFVPGQKIRVLTAIQDNGWPKGKIGTVVRAAGKYMVAIEVDNRALCLMATDVEAVDLDS